MYLNSEQNLTLSGKLLELKFSSLIKSFHMRTKCYLIIWE